MRTYFDANEFWTNVKIVAVKPAHDAHVQTRNHYIEFFTNGYKSLVESRRVGPMPRSHFEADAYNAGRAAADDYLCPN